MENIGHDAWNTPGCSTFSENPERMQEVFPKCDKYQNECNNRSDLFSVKVAREVVFDDVNFEISTKV